jgi:hypothetical protein
VGTDLDPLNIWGWSTLGQCFTLIHDWTAARQALERGPADHAGTSSGRILARHSRFTRRRRGESARDVRKLDVGARSHRGGRTRLSFTGPRP